MQSEPKIDKSTIQRHWEEKLPINDGLKRIMEDLARDCVNEIGVELRQSTPQSREEMLKEAGNIYELPYGRIGMIPPAVFGEISEDTIQLKSSLVVPESDEEIASLAERYDKWAFDLVDSKKYGAYGFSTRESVMGVMSKFKGMEYPHEAWLTAAKAMQQALKDEPNFRMELFRAHRADNDTALDYDQLSPLQAEIYRGYRSHVLVMSQQSSGETLEKGYGYNGFRDFVALPITEYGKEAAGKLARVTVALNDFIKTSSIVDRGVRERITPEDESLLIQHTARSRDRHKDSMEDPAVHGVKSTLAEGILTMAQTISFLTAEKVEGYDGYDELVAAILDSQIIEQFTRIVRPGFIGPVTLSGLYVPGALIQKNGKLTLGKELVEMLSKMKKEYITQIMTEWALYESGKGTVPVALGMTCPAAAPKGAITELKSVLSCFYQ